MQKKGIDISHHQGDIDFNSLKGNIDFAMVRTSYGSFYEDKKYKQNIKGLERINVPYGFYHFSYATSVESAKKEAEGFINIIKKYNPTYPIVIDIEWSNRTENVKADTLISITDTICSMIEKAGYYAMIYANLDYFNNKLNDPTYKKSFGIWQYSSKGQIPGIKGNVDLNISYKDYPSIIKSKKTDDNRNETSKTNEINYVVKKGDTLSLIASKYNTTYQKLASYNNISNPNKIYPGQIIKIKQEMNINPTNYVVKKGDTLSSIASRYKTSWKKIYEKNKNIIGKNPDKIKPGQVLSI